MKYITKDIERNLDALRKKGINSREIIFCYTKVFPDTELLPILEVYGGKTREGKNVDEGIDFKNEDVTVLFSWDPSLHAEGEPDKDRYTLEIYLTLGAVKQNGAKSITAVLLDTPYKSSSQLISLFEKQMKEYADNILTLDDFLCGC